MVLPESPKFLLTIQRHDQALEVLKRVYAYNTGQKKEVSSTSLEILSKKLNFLVVAELPREKY